MHMKNIAAIVLAAGKGTRMRSETPKVLHKILGKPIIRHIVDSVKEAGITDIITVAGFGSSLLKNAVNDTKVAVQKRLLGSADAVVTAKKAIGKNVQDILIICGDTPLIKGKTIKALIAKHKSSKASLTLLTAKLRDPRPYGRVVRGSDGKILKIVEETEASLYEEVINEINVGTYCFSAKDLYEELSEIKPDN